ncbi:MAG: CDP-archaeol synthase [Pseudomonadota bacterium]
MAILAFIVLLLVANGAPLFTAYFLGPHYAAPIDGGRLLPDGNRLFGRTKTWRGLVAALFCTSFAAVFLGYSFFLGSAVAVMAMTGDLISSFAKRRQGLASSSFAFGLDQIPEALLPALAVGMPLLGFSLLEVALVVVIFLALELVSSGPLHRLGIRKPAA